MDTLKILPFPLLLLFPARCRPQICFTFSLYYIASLHWSLLFPYRIYFLFLLLFLFLFFLSSSCWSPLCSFLLSCSVAQSKSYPQFSRLLSNYQPVPAEGEKNSDKNLYRRLQPVPTSPLRKAVGITLKMNSCLWSKSWFE